MDAKSYRPNQPTTKELRELVKEGQENFFAEMEAGLQREFCRATKRFYLRPKEASPGSVIYDAEGREIGRWT